MDLLSITVWLLFLCVSCVCGFNGGAVQHADANSNSRRLVRYTQGIVVPPSVRTTGAATGKVSDTVSSTVITVKTANEVKTANGVKTELNGASSAEAQAVVLSVKTANEVEMTAVQAASSSTTSFGWITTTVLIAAAVVGVL